MIARLDTRPGFAPAWTPNGIATAIATSIRPIALPSIRFQSVGRKGRLEPDAVMGEGKALLTANRDPRERDLRRILQISVPSIEPTSQEDTFRTDTMKDIRPD